MVMIEEGRGVFFFLALGRMVAFGFIVDDLHTVGVKYQSRSLEATAKHNEKI